MANTFFKSVVLDTGLRDHGLQGLVAVGTQGHQAFDVAHEGGIGALTQKLQTPQPLGHVELRPKQQWRGVVKHPFQHLEGGPFAGPRLAITHRYLSRVAKAGFHGGVGLSVNQRHLVTQRLQVPSGAGADDAGT